ncbi:MAG: hypothetical protein ACRC28_04335 [Clostridium sp.]|uniref:hypothetical protein n=1 Tax=Clostridium sp. TaxID=1506 RepID=UPI003F2E9D89
MPFGLVVASAQVSGNIQARNLIFYDTIPNGTTYMMNSLLINGVNTVGNLQNGVALPNVNPGESVTIQFSVKVN